MKKILGISAFYHDSAAALIVDGNIIAAAQEERFTRVKNTAEFPINAINFCLREAGYKINELDAIVFYDKPFNKFKRLIETYMAFYPKGLRQFIVSIPSYIREKSFLKSKITKLLSKIGQLDRKKTKLLFSEHHLSHAASTFYTSEFQNSAILTIDGVGEYATASIAYGRDNKVIMLQEMQFPHSVGLLYSSFTYFLGFKVNSGEYKLMGLAPYGNSEDEQTKYYIKVIKEEIVDIKNDGSIFLNNKYFNYATGLEMINERDWKNLFGFNKLNPSDEIQQCHCNLAFAIQNVIEEIILKMAREAKKITGSENLCMSGGVALNCVANGKLLKENIFNKIHIQPAAGDSGGAVGAALAAYYMYFESKRSNLSIKDKMKGTYLGPSYENNEILEILNKYNSSYKYYDDFEELCSMVSSLIVNGKIIGWFQGRMEFGPRALGNRSILADARNEKMQKFLNLKIKYREGFRPFAPSVLLEDIKSLFDINVSSPYMLYTCGLLKNRIKEIPITYPKLDLWDKLYFSRSDFQAITHIDFSARIQTVEKETNLRFWTLLKKVKEKIGHGIVINTSFNVRGEPIVCSPEDAYKCFMNTEMDYLVLNNYLLKKEDQPQWNSKIKWKAYYNPD